jgi:Autotransporter beta-domain
MLGGVTLCAGWAGSAAADPDGCTVVANVATCSGDQSGGIDQGDDFEAPPVDTLIINNLTRDIGSNISGQDGVRWAPGLSGHGPINVIADTGEFAIRANADGYNLFSPDGEKVTIDHTGDIFAGSIGIRAGNVAFGAGLEADDVSVTARGNIVSGGSSISATSSYTSGDGDSGNVSVQFTGDAKSIFAESDVEDGNGDSGTVTVESNGLLSFGVQALSTVFGNGNSGNVSVSHQGASSGIFARSIVGGDGSAGAVSVSLTGDMDDAVLAESVVEGTGTSGAVTVGTSGDISSASTGIVARSLGSAGQGDIHVTLFEGRVSGTTAGVEIDGGATNILTIGSQAAIASEGAAILGGDGDETVGNSGLVDGDVSLGAGANIFFNFLGGTFNTGTIIDIGAGGFLHNEGLMSLGGENGAPVTTTLTGDFSQGLEGTLAVDAAGVTADRIDVSGTAELDGFVRATVRGMNSLAQQFTIMSAAGGITDLGIEVVDSAIFDFELLFPNANDMILSVTADLTPTDAVLTPNQHATAEHLEDALAAGGGDLGDVFGYLGSLEGVAGYAAGLDRLHPEPYLAQTRSLLFSNLGFADGLMSCDASASRFLSEGDCAWLRVGGRHLDSDRTAQNIGVDEDSWSASAGAQKEIAPDRFVSLAAGYENSDLDVDDRAIADGHIFHAGVSYKLVHGNWQVTGALSGGYAQFDTTRLDVMPGINADGEARYGFASTRLRAAYLFERESLHIKPLVDADAIAIQRNSLHETGAGGASLDIASDTDVLLSLAPAVEIGGEFAPTESGLIRPFLRAGVRLFSDDDLNLSAAFIGSPDVADFTATTPIDRLMGQVSAGVDFVSGDRFDARASYDGMVGERAVQHVGSLKLRMKF